MNRPEWLTDERFKDDLARGEHRHILCPIMADWCATRTTVEALAELEAHTVPAGPVLSFQQSLDHEAVQALAHLQPTMVDGVSVPLARPPFSLSALDKMAPQKPPQIGEHTDAILTELGYSSAGISALRADKII